MIGSLISELAGGRGVRAKIAKVSQRPREAGSGGFFKNSPKCGGAIASRLGDRPAHGGTEGWNIQISEIGWPDSVCDSH